MNDKKMVLIDRMLIERAIAYIDAEHYELTANELKQAIEKAPGAVLPVTQAHEWTCCPIFKYTSGKNKTCSCYENCPQVVKE